jgi:hypothetical protein
MDRAVHPKRVKTSRAARNASMLWRRYSSDHKHLRVATKVVEGTKTSRAYAREVSSPAVRTISRNIHG